MANVVKAPGKYDLRGKVGVFLAGSIEMGKAVNWQTKVEDGLEEFDEVVVLNPRRDDWDSSWEQTKDNPQFNEQVTWELQALEDADVIVMYFDPDTKSPITLLELGIHSHAGKLIVCCSEGFWRKGNVDIVCERYNVQQVDSLDKLIQKARQVVGERFLWE